MKEGALILLRVYRDARIRSVRRIDCDDRLGVPVL